MLVECLTDNRNRTISEVRRAFTKANGALGEPGSVAWQFTEKGYLAFNRVDQNGAVLDLDPDALFLAAIESGAADVELSADAVEIYTERTDFAQVSQALEEQGFAAAQAELAMQPNTTIELGMEEAAAVLDLIEALEELDDVSKVYHNLELTEDVVAQFA
jgi:YebC/PmpR family DNA-binding regulatory protein